MKRSARFTTAILLAGLVQVSLPGVVWAENARWFFFGQYTQSNESLLSEPASAMSVQKGADNLTGWIDFGCKPGDLVSKFRASVSAAKIDMKSLDRIQNAYPSGDYKVFWIVDNGVTVESVWSSNPEGGGLMLVGRQAFDLALDILRAKKQIKIETPRGIIVNDLKDSRNTIIRLLKHCNRI